MDPRASSRFLGSSDPPRLPVRKRPGHWLTTPAAAVGCAGISTPIQVALAAPALVKDDPGAGTEPARKKRKSARLVHVEEAEEEQVTRDLCASFLDLESTVFRAVVPWRSNSNSPNGTDPQQSGTTSEEDLHTRDTMDQDSADTVRSAAELLTQLIGKRNTGSGNSQLRRPGSPQSEDPHGRALEEPIRWGVKKKVSYESRRSVDSCDLGICTGLTRKLSHDQERSGATTADPNVSPSPLASWVLLSPSVPASSDLLRDRRSSGIGLASTSLHSPGTRFRGSRSDRPRKIVPSTQTCPLNILKLPKEMQGRWSCERYKVAQLKLIEIMQNRKAAPGTPILRPALREEARKHIGDTGLLDHLLKHMTDTVVSTGERFRRRHNSEGAMEYWLEHASLMELRKAAGVEDPSWMPPAGWKVGDKLPDRNWQVNRGMTFTEASEMKNLKETLDRLKSEMKVLCGSITASIQRGALPCPNVCYPEPLGALERADGEDNPILPSLSEIPIREETIQFERNFSHIGQERHADIKSGTNARARFHNLESAVPQAHEDRQPQKVQIGSTSGNPLDLESQLQDVSRAVSMVQEEVRHVICVLGVVPPIKAKPMRYPMEPGNKLVHVLSAGNETGSTNQRKSPECRPTDASKPVTDGLVNPNQDAPIRQCSNASRGVKLGNRKDQSAPYTDGLSQALSNYNLVNRTGPLSAHPLEKNNDSGSTMRAQDDGPHVTAPSRPQNFKPVQTSPPTGFTICRPAGSFLWPTMLNGSQVLPTNKVSMPGQEQTVDWRLLEGVSGNISLRGMPTSPPESLLNQSTGSIAESKVAATMATIFGCMAMASPLPLPTLPLVSSEVDSAGNFGQCSFSSTAEQCNPALVLSLSLPVSPEFHMASVPLCSNPSLSEDASATKAYCCAALTDLAKAVTTLLS